MEYENLDEDDGDMFNQQPASPSDSDYFSTGPMEEDPPSPYPIQQQQQEDGGYTTSRMDWIEFDMFANNTPSLGLFLTGQFTLLVEFVS